MVSPYRKSLEANPASTSSTSSDILLCPVTGQVIPSLEKIEETIEKNLTLSNPYWPRWVYVKGIALALRRWAQEVGLEKAKLRGQMVLEGGEMQYADLANLPWIPKGKIEPLTPEKFAERLGGIVDELERTRVDSGSGRDASEGNNGNDQRLLPGGGAPPEGGVGGSDAGTPGTPGGDGEDGGAGSTKGGRVLDFPAERRDRHGRRDGLSRRLVVIELREHELDLKAFQNAYSCIHRRVQEVKDESQMMKLVEWSGTSAVMGSLELAIHAIERVVGELRDILLRIDRGAIPNLDED